MGTEQQVAKHYDRPRLERAILDGLLAAGKDIEHLNPADLAPVDEFHIGGRQATMEFAQQLGVVPGLHLLDVGCGIGGPSRYFVHERDCRVTGVDLTDEYVRVSRALARRVGLAGRVSYQRASATALPFKSEAFDGAYMLHVGMNIEDKRALCAGIRRVLRPGGLFGIYDVMRERDGPLSFPVPWAATPATSVVESAAAYREHLERAGFVVVAQRSHRDFAIEFFRQLRARSSETGPPPLGLHLLMGADSGTKIANMVANLEAGLISPTEIIARVPG